jgi:hypothetical protein
MKSAHSLTLSNDWRLLSTCAANFLYLASLANKDAAAALRQFDNTAPLPLPVRRRCSGVDLPLVPPSSSAQAVTGDAS